MFEKRRYVICRLAVAGTRSSGTAVSRWTIIGRWLASLPGRTKGAVARRGPSRALIVECIRHAGHSPHREWSWPQGSTPGGAAGRAATRRSCKFPRRPCSGGSGAEPPAHCTEAAHSTVRAHPLPSVSGAAGQGAHTVRVRATSTTGGDCRAWRGCSGHDRRSQGAGGRVAMGREAVRDAAPRGRCRRYCPEPVRTGLRPGERSVVIDGDGASVRSMDHGVALRVAADAESCFVHPADRKAVSAAEGPGSRLASRRSDCPVPSPHPFPPASTACAAGMDLPCKGISFGAGWR